MSQSAASQRLKLLEEELGVSLLSRKKGFRNIELTEFGTNFIPICKKWIELEDETHNLRELAPVRNLTIVSPNSLNYYIFPPLYRKISSEEKQLQLIIKTYHYNEILNAIDKDEADVGFVFYAPMYMNITSKIVYSEKMYMICKKGSVWKGKKVHPRDLDPQKELYSRWSSSIDQWHKSWWNPSIQPHIQTDIPGLIINLLTEDDYWGLCPASIINLYNLAEHVEIHEFTEAPPPRNCRMIMRENLSEKQKESISIFEKYLNDYINKLSFDV